MPDIQNEVENIHRSIRSPERCGGSLVEDGWSMCFTLNQWFILNFGNNGNHWLKVVEDGYTNYRTIGKPVISHGFWLLWFTQAPHPPRNSMIPTSVDKSSQVSQAAHRIGEDWNHQAQTIEKLCNATSQTFWKIQAKRSEKSKPNVLKKWRCPKSWGYPKMVMEKPIKIWMICGKPHFRTPPNPNNIYWTHD